MQLSIHWGLPPVIIIMPCKCFATVYVYTERPPDEAQVGMNYDIADCTFDSGYLVVKCNYSAYDRI